MVMNVDPAFEKMSNKQELAEWLMRQYFSPDKHSGEIYYKSSVTSENVLEYISNPSNHFPQTPADVAKIWKILPSLREGLKNISDDVVQKEEIYTRGLEKLDVIGKAIGGVTKVSVSKISEAATTKMSAMLQGLNGSNHILAKQIDTKIENAYLNVCECFADAAQISENAWQLLDYIVEKGYLTVDEVTEVDDIELEGLNNVIELAKDGMSQYELETIFLEDINKYVNVFQLVQLAISKIVFPPNKNGRFKKKNLN